MALEREESVAKLIFNFLINTRKTAKQKQTHGYFCARKALLEDYWNRYSQARDDVANLEETTDNSESRRKALSESRFTAVEIAYCEAMGELNDDIANIARATSSSVAPIHAGAAHQPNVTLPKIELPKFDGNLQHWLNFKDLFETCIVKEKSLSNVQRLHYLKACLKGDAEHLVRNIAVTDHNFQIAWELLSQRYDSTRRLIKCHLRAIANLPKTNSESASQIRNILDVVNGTYRALIQLGRPTEQWDDWFVFHVTEKLDAKTVKDWEISLGASDTIPSYDDLNQFLQGRVQGLEAVNTSEKLSNTSSTKPFIGPRATGSVRSHQTSVSRCVCCSEKHALPACPNFRKLQPKAKINLVRSHNLCENCLRGSHAMDSCTSKYTCKDCHAKHHTFLHDSFLDKRVIVNHNRLKPTVSSSSENLPDVLLATALIGVQSPSGHYLKLRALLDPGSQATFISEFAAQQLRLPRSPVAVPITGIGSASVGTSNGLCEFTLRSLQEPEFNIRCISLILPRLGHLIPAAPINPDAISEFSNLKLADPTFAEPGRVDVVVGADIYGSLLYNELKRSTNNAPVAQNTHLGWVVYGPIVSNIKPHLHAKWCVNTAVELNELVQQMWAFNQHEDLASPQPMTMDELYCEEYFEKTTQRDNNGRFSVRYPFKVSANLSALRESKHDALRLFEYQRQRLRRDPKKKTLYEQFMAEYISLGHMQPILESDEPNQSCYIPHHGVYKELSSTTKLRAVFNASRKYSSGVSLNACLHTGPKLQSDLASLLIKWRLHRIAFMADIEKCFRQIMVHDEDADMQRIFWSNAEGNPQAFRLRTVTYGFNCSPYLTIKVLHPLAKEEEAQYPRAAKVLRESFYMDDCLHGADNVGEAVSLKRELQELLRCGGFSLRKWNSNSIDFLRKISSDIGTPVETYCNLALDQETKALGIFWTCGSDTIGYKVSLALYTGPITKRQQLSDVAKTYDPLGFLAPVIIVGKIIFQELWVLGCAWDDPIPSPHQQKWQKFRNELPYLESVKIGRWVHTSASTISYQLHIFADASKSAYAAVCYLRVIATDGTIHVSMLMAKTKVAPLKKITVPRLELNAALLAAKLAVKVTDALQIDNIKIHCWSDSKTTLSWIRSNPGQHQQYIANRVAQIQERTPVHAWKYVSTACNPADVATRGVMPSDIANIEIWWSGPTWLNKCEEDWPIQPKLSITSNTIVIAAITTSVSDSIREHLLAKYTNINKLLAVTAWCRRFLKAKLNLPHSTEAWCTASERASALNLWLRYVQNFNFSNEIFCLRQGKPLPIKSKLRKLNPTIDGDGILRVNGRLKHAFLSDAERFPIILPKDDKLTILLIAQAHECTLHGGVQTTLNFMRRRFWPIDGRSSIKKYINRCMKCFRYRCQPASQIMGTLPTARCRPTKPFTHCGIDYGGPYRVRVSKGRGHQAHKAYVALFVCFSTRAIHLELVSDLTTNMFLLAVRRFFAIRGYCSDIYSDCATTFVGANAILKEDIAQYRKQLEAGARYGAVRGVSWHFIPPGSPNFGGIWEAGIKSMKHHLKRVIGDVTLTFEEFYTVLKEVEAVLNSRPLAPLSDDPDDITAITPAHLLSGGPLIAPPEPNLVDIKTSRLTRWRQLQQLHQHFWQRWSTDYLRELQVRNKWQQTQKDLKIGDMVLLRDERAPPSKWLLGRVIQVHPGDDSHVRVATVRTKSTDLKRALSKLVRLPIEEEYIPHTVGG